MPLLHELEQTVPLPANYVTIAADPGRHAEFPARSGHTLNPGGPKTNMTTPNLRSIVTLPDFFQKRVLLNVPTLQPFTVQIK